MQELRSFLPSSSDHRLASGDSHLVFLLEDQVYTWGSNEHGQLGTGTTQPYHEAPFPIDFRQPVAVAAGNETSAVITADGNLYMWGANRSGQLGTENRGIHVPTRVNLPHPVMQVDGGVQFTLIVTAQGTLYICGVVSIIGLIGTNLSIVDTSIPTLIELPLPVLQIAAGRYHATAVLSDGSLYTWGVGEYGQLGNGRLNFQAVPERVDFPYPVASIAAGYLHTALITTDGELYVCGSNAAGILGIRSGRALEIVLVRIDMPSEVLTVATGNSYTVVNTYDGIYVWGNGGYGQFGTGDKERRTVPTRVDVGVPSRKVVEIAAGTVHTTLLTDDGQVYVWGSTYNISRPAGLSIAEIVSPEGRLAPIRIT